MIRVFFSMVLCCTTFLCLGQTQLEMNQEALKKYQKADKELNTVYQKVIKEYSQDTVFITNFKKAQKLWVQFRDAEMKALYPDREAGYYGSIHPLCWSTTLTNLTKERTAKLKVWITGIEDGGCTSSVKAKK